MVAVLIGCGLRRSEAAALKLEDIQLREGHWVIADLNGKGGHIRTVPMPDWVKRAIDEWTVSAGLTSGPLFRIASELASKRLAVLKIEGLPIMRQWFVVRPSDRELPPAGQALWGFISSKGRSFLPNYCDA